MTSLDLAMAIGWFVLSSPTGGYGSKGKKEESWDCFPKYPSLVFFVLSFLSSTPSAPLHHFKDRNADKGLERLLCSNLRRVQRPNRPNTKGKKGEMEFSPLLSHLLPGSH